MICVIFSSRCLCPPPLRLSALPLACYAFCFCSLLFRGEKGGTEYPLLYVQQKGEDDVAAARSLTPHYFVIVSSLLLASSHPSLW